MSGSSSGSGSRRDRSGSSSGSGSRRDTSGGFRSVGRKIAAPVRVLNRAEERYLPGVFRLLWRQRQTIALAAASIMFAAAFVHLQRFDPGVITDAEPEDDPVLEEVDPGEASQVVGPAIGDDLAEHQRDATARLDDADDGDTRLAVVSFTEYLTTADIADVLPGGVTVHRAQIRLPVEGQEPIDVEAGDDVAGAVEDALQKQRADMVAEEEELQRLLDSDTVEDEEFEEFYAEEVERLRTTRAHIDEGAGTVFAVAVEADVAPLRALAAHDRVRLVDVAEPGAEVAETTFYGILPEETGAASFGHLG